MFSCKFAAYFLNTSSYEHLWTAVFDTHKKNKPSDKTEAPAKSMIMYIWPISVLN